MKESTKQRRRGRSRKDANDNGKSDLHSPIINDENTSKWYKIGADLVGRDATIASNPPQPSFHQDNESLVLKYRNLADFILQREIETATKSSVQESDERWVENTMKKGTLKDRIAAISVTVSAQPIHKFGSLDGLLSMAGCAESGGKTNSRVAQLASEALEDLFVNTLLPNDRKLLSLDQRPLYIYEPSKCGKKTSKTLSPRILLLWRFEEKLKSKYEIFLRRNLSRTLKDGLEIHKIAALHSASSLLSSVPEGEQELLAMIVNKLGDPGKKTAASAGHQLRLILQRHPNMQVVVTREVQQLAHRSHLSARALYNCVVFLNQLKLQKIDEPSDAHTRSENLPSSLINTYFRIFEIAVKPNKQGSKHTREGGINSRLLSALLSGVNRARPYLPPKNQAMDEYVDSLYRVVHDASPSASTQALMLLFHLVVGIKLHDSNLYPIENNTRRNRFYRALYATLKKPAHISHGKHSTMFFNLLYRGMKYDDDNRRVNVFAKRLMSTALHTNAAPVAGCIFLLNEVARSKPSLRVCFENVPAGGNGILLLDDSKREPLAAVVALRDGTTEASTDDETASPPTWELSLVSQHYHPSISMFARTVGEISYAGDPLRDFSIAPFLDKFSYRNPKSTRKTSERKSIAARRSGMELWIQSSLELPVNDPKFLEQERVSEQDEFFLKFFSERARRDEIKGTKIHDEFSKTDNDEEEASDDEERAALETADVDLAAKSFAELEQAWDTDSEEEAFAASLAEQLIESGADGDVNFDDEDPDMSDWSEYGSNRELGSLKDDLSFDEDADESFLDMAFDSDTDTLIENLHNDSDVFVDAEEHENMHLIETDDPQHGSRQKRRKTSLGPV